MILLVVLLLLLLLLLPLQPGSEPCGRVGAQRVRARAQAGREVGLGVDVSEQHH